MYSYSVNQASNNATANNASSAADYSTFLDLKRLLRVSTSSETAPRSPLTKHIILVSSAKIRPSFRNAAHSSKAETLGEAWTASLKKSRFLTDKDERVRLAGATSERSLRRSASSRTSVSTAEEWAASLKESLVLADKAKRVREVGGDVGAISREIDNLNKLYKSRKA